jgi:hypothetical protein
LGRVEEWALGGLDALILNTKDERQARETEMQPRRLVPVIGLRDPQTDHPDPLTYLPLRAIPSCRRPMTRRAPECRPPQRTAPRPRLVAAVPPSSISLCRIGAEQVSYVRCPPARRPDLHSLIQQEHPRLANRRAGRTGSPNVEDSPPAERDPGSRNRRDSARRGQAT